jgi:hypothetical protein
MHWGAVKRPFPQNALGFGWWQHFIMTKGTRNVQTRAPLSGSQL